MLENDGDADKTRAAFLTEREGTWGRGTRPLPDLFEAIFYANENNRVEAYVLIPRHPDLRKARNFAVSTEAFQVIPLSDLRSTLERLDSKYLNARR
jgi:hypothetical protein